MPCSRCTSFHPCRAHSACVSRPHYIFHPSACSYCCSNFLGALTKEDSARQHWESYISKVVGFAKRSTDASSFWGNELDRRIFGSLKDPISSDFQYLCKDDAVSSLTTILTAEGLLPPTDSQPQPSSGGRHDDSSIPETPRAPEEAPVASHGSDPSGPQDSSSEQRPEPAERNASIREDRCNQPEVSIYRFSSMSAYFTLKDWLP